MPPSNTNLATGTASIAAAVASFGFTATSGRLLVLAVGSDDYNSGNPTGYTLSTQMKQETFLGSYLWWKIASGGETSVTYNLNSAAQSAWIVAEFSGIDATPYDGSAGQLTLSPGTSYTTPNLTPTSGERLLLALMGGARETSTWTGTSSWTNSFTKLADSFQNVSATRDIIGLASIVVTANGSTAYSSGATYNVGPDAATGMVIAFKGAAAGRTTKNTRSAPLGTEIGMDWRS